MGGPASPLAGVLLEGVHLPCIASIDEMCSMRAETVMELLVCDIGTRQSGFDGLMIVLRSRMTRCTVSTESFVALCGWKSVVGLDFAAGERVAGVETSGLDASIGALRQLTASRLMMSHELLHRRKQSHSIQTRQQRIRAPMVRE